MRYNSFEPDRCGCHGSSGEHGVCCIPGPAGPRGPRGLPGQTGPAGPAGPAGSVTPAEAVDDVTNPSQLTARFNELLAHMRAAGLLET